MGTRVNYFLVSDVDCVESHVPIILFSNNVHSSYDPEKRIVELANESVGITELATKLLNESYELGTGSPGEKGRHFWLDATAGDNEKVVFVYWDSAEELASKGYIPATVPILKELPSLTRPLMSEIRKYL